MEFCLFVVWGGGGIIGQCCFRNIGRNQIKFFDLVTGRDRTGKSFNLVILGWTASNFKLLNRANLQQRSIFYKPCLEIGP